MHLSLSIWFKQQRVKANFVVLVLAFQRVLCICKISSNFQRQRSASNIELG